MLLNPHPSWLNTWASVLHILRSRASKSMCPYPMLCTVDITCDGIAQASNTSLKPVQICERQHTHIHAYKVDILMDVFTIHTKVNYHQYADSSKCNRKTAWRETLKLCFATFMRFKQSQMTNNYRWRSDWKRYRCKVVVLIHETPACKFHYIHLIRIPIHQIIKRN